MELCPICQANYDAIAFSNDVCEKHQDWLVTKCVGCGWTKFSDTRNICPDCASIPPEENR